MKLKRILALVLALAMVFTLAACGGGEEKEPETTDPGTEAATTSITFATYPVGNMANESVVNELIAAFNAEHPEISVTVQYLDYTNGDDTVNTAIELSLIHI